MAPARGGDRTDRRHRCPVPTGRLLAVLGATALAVGVAGTAPRAAAGTARASGTTLSLLAPPTVAGPGSPFDVRLGVSGPVAPTGLTVGVTVYAHLLDLTQFDETLDGSPVGSVVASSDAIPVSSLPADPQGGVDLKVPVTAGGVTGAGTGPFTADLTCQLGSCGGVYPVELKLTDTATGTVTARLLTYLVYTDPAGDIEPLRFALVVPLALASPPAGPPGATGVPAQSLGGLIAVESALSGPRASVPLTVIPGPATVEALGGDRSERARTALSSLVSLTTDPGRQTLCGPFVPVDASALVSATSGGITELAEQVRRGAQVLGSVPGLHAGGCAAGEGWVADGTLDTAALDALGSLGFSEMVIPPGAVTGPPSSTTPTRRFTLSGAPHAVTAILSDPGLSDLLRSPGRGGPALAADQILAELEFDYYEAQNTPAPRGVVAAPPTTAGVDPAVVADLLDGLQNNPMVEPATLATLFTDVPVGGTVGRFAQPSSRRPAGVGNATGLPGPAIAAARAQWTGFSAAVSGSPAGAAVAAGLDDQLLVAESRLLSPDQQRAGVARFEDTFHHQLSLLSITSREVRLTARTGSVPITVIKNAPYPVEAVLTVTSDKIAFSAGSAQVPNTECRTPVVTNSAGGSSVSSLCTFVHGTNAVYIEMRSRVSGDFRVSVTLSSPQAGLELASGQLTVRSMSTSAVAIALSVAAGAVLLGWWGRTMWRNPRTRRGAHRRGRGDGS
ncbi:MAG TPA: DUF6049 family protein [Acidimicrobiales bacterium]|nr:DUF6049 family protein [Acidimicrobiales bacterium]